MKVKILIGAICFIVGAGAYYLYENNFSLSSKIEKCADSKYLPVYLKKNRVNLKDSLKKKLKNMDYEMFWELCENERKKYPLLFEKTY